MQKRWRSSTPRFFRKLQNAALIVSAVGSLLMASPEILPGWMVLLGGYLAVAGGVVSAVSQLAVDNPDGLEDAVHAEESGP